MRSNPRFAATMTATLAAVSMLVAACSSGPAPSSPAAPSVSSAPASPAPSAPATTYWLRMRTTQAIPPVDLFAVPPALVITGDGLAVINQPVPAIFPGPLLPNLVGRRLSGGAQLRILTAARDLGLLGGRTDFSPANPVMGGVAGHIEIGTEGQRVELTGDPSALMECPQPATCDPQPGTAQAFARFWSMLTDLPTFLGSEIGAENSYAAASYAVLVGRAPNQQPELPQAPADWPLDQSLALFGGPVANGAARCGTVSGAEAETLRPALVAANQLTQWVQDPTTSATFGLTVRPMVPGEDICREIFGP